MSCADVECNKMSFAQKAFNPCCNGSRAITPAKKKSQGQKDIEEFVRGKNPPENKKNTSEDTRNILEKVAQDGPSAGGRPGDSETGGDGGGGGGDGTICGQDCNAKDPFSNFVCQGQKLFASCGGGPVDNCFGLGIPCGMLAIGGLAAVILIMVLK